MKPRTSDPDSVAAARALVEWFRVHGRDYPWRQTVDPYSILVSEVMLQQTQIATVLDRGYYDRWMSRFPDWATLAAASEEEVLKAWEGLGYYRRARNLQRLATVILADHGGEFPREIAEMESLPGVGPYTAGAVASFAFDLPQPIVDGNVARVLSRLYDDATPIDSNEGKTQLWARAGEMVRGSGSPRLFNSAIMELGQTICRPLAPRCSECPVKAQCKASAPEKLPVKQIKTEITAIMERVIFSQNAEGILLEQEIGSRRTGMWKLPALVGDHSHFPVIVKTTYGITRYKVTLWVHEAAEMATGENIRRVSLAEVEDLAMPSPYRKALRAILGARHFELKA